MKLKMNARVDTVSIIRQRNKDTINYLDFILGRVYLFDSYGYWITELKHYET